MTSNHARPMQQCVHDGSLCTRLELMFRHLRNQGWKLASDRPHACLVASLACSASHTQDYDDSRMQASHVPIVVPRDEWSAMFDLTAHRCDGNPGALRKLPCELHDLQTASLCSFSSLLLLLSHRRRDCEFHCRRRARSQRCQRLNSRRRQKEDTVSSVLATDTLSDDESCPLQSRHEVLERGLGAAHLQRAQIKAFLDGAPRSPPRRLQPGAHSAQFSYGCTVGCEALM